MKSGRSTGTPTKAQQVRFDAIKDMGCVIARIRGEGYIPCEIHHMTLGNRHGQKRLGHDFTVGLNPWSHRGVPFYGWTGHKCRALFGPSYAREPRAFRELYPDDLLLQAQGELLKGRDGTIATAGALMAVFSMRRVG